MVNGGSEEVFTLSRYKGKQYVLLFFYPKDCTLVCPTELWDVQKALPEFEARERAIVACSMDSEFSRLAWSLIPRDKSGIIRHMVVNDMRVYSHRMQRGGLHAAMRVHAHRTRRGGLHATPIAGDSQGTYAKTCRRLVSFRVATS